MLLRIGLPAPPPARPPGIKSIPQGAGDIPDDIASTFATRRAEAERIKCFYGSASTSPRDNHDMIEVAPPARGPGGGGAAPAGRGGNRGMSERARSAGGQDGVESARITRAELVAVIRRRLESLTGEIALGVAPLGFSQAKPRQGGAD